MKQCKKSLSLHVLFNLYLTLNYYSTNSISNYLSIFIFYIIYCLVYCIKSWYIIIFSQMIYYSRFINYGVFEVFEVFDKYFISLFGISIILYHKIF